MSPYEPLPKPLQFLGLGNQWDETAFLSRDRLLNLWLQLCTLPVRMVE